MREPLLAGAATEFCGDVGCGLATDRLFRPFAEAVHQVRHVLVIKIRQPTPSAGGAATVEHMVPSSAQ